MINIPVNFVFSFDDNRRQVKKTILSIELPSEILEEDQIDIEKMYDQINEELRRTETHPERCVLRFISKGIEINNGELSVLIDDNLKDREMYLETDIMITKGCICTVRYYLNLKYDNKPDIVIGKVKARW